MAFDRAAAQLGRARAAAVQREALYRKGFGYMRLAGASS
jgi:hypothetical protein